jgi:Asp-tRNA(Asn)/Glu-tRNA(Gln) amidotransferase A subunit family amidase
MPVGLQLFAPAFEEERLIEVGHVLQQNIDPLPLPFGLQD